MLNILLVRRNEVKTNPASLSYVLHWRSHSFGKIMRTSSKMANNKIVKSVVTLPRIVILLLVEL